ncbi:MAG: thiol-disulfide oxidoreductase DCC family protein [Cellvibrionaceae bacterium]
MAGKVLTIFYDGLCPMCSLEMNKLKQHDLNNLITLIDIHQEIFRLDYPHIGFDKAMQILHGQYDGKILLGLDVTHRAWTLVGKGFWVAPLAFPLVRQLAHLFYLLVARHRHRISRFLHQRLGIGRASCSRDVCR